MGLAVLIDDDQSLLSSIRRLARLRGLRVELASTWEEGIGLFHVLAPSVVIADYHMPHSQYGLQLLAEIKELRPSVRVVLISAFINDEDVQKIDALGIVDRTLRKIGSTNAIDDLVEEIRTANESDAEQTDWVDVAKARVRVAAASRKKLDRLDEFFKQNRAP